MEDTSGPVIQTPFGEGAVSELISHWLEEGDRLSASAADLAAPATESRVRKVIERLQPVVARHRLFVFAGIGLLPLVLILSTQRRAPAQPPAATVAFALPVAAPAMTEARPAPSAPAHTAPAPTPPTPTSVTTTVPPATGTLASAGSFEPAPPRQQHHHHHHHHATSAPVRAVASAGHATRR